MKTNRLFSLLLIVTLLAISFTTVVAQEEEIPGVTDAIDATQPWEIAYVIKNTINPFWLNTMEGAESGEDFGVNVTVLAPQKPDNVEEQIRIIEDLIQQGVDGMVVTPLTPRAWPQPSRR